MVTFSLGVEQLSFYVYPLLHPHRPCINKKTVSTSQGIRNACIYNCDTCDIYKTVLLQREVQDISDNGVGTIQNTIKTFFNDPFVNILLKNSHLTKIQLETFLINHITDHYPQKDASTKSDKEKLRLRRGGVSKGAFYRTLSQAKANIDKTLFTILLLGYIGVLDSPSLIPFLELSNKLQTYITYFKDKRALNTLDDENNIITMRLMQKRLVSEVKALINT